MIITLDNTSDLEGTQDFLNIEQKRRTIPFTVRCLAAHYASHEEVEVQIAADLFPLMSSYKLNPAQLAKNANVEGNFARVSGLRKGPYVVVLFTNAPAPESFWMQALKCCQNVGTYKYPLEAVPLTYRHTPSLLKYRLKEFTGKKVRVLRTATELQIIIPRQKN